MKKSLLAALATAGCVTAALTAGAGASQAVGDHHQSRTAAVASARANAFAHAGLTRGQDARVKDTILDRNGASHVRFDRTFRGLRVVGGDFVIHQAPGGSYRSVSGRQLTNGLRLETEATVPGRKAVASGPRVGRLQSHTDQPGAGRAATGHGAPTPHLAGRRGRPPRGRLPRRRVRLRRRPKAATWSTTGPRSSTKPGAAAVYVGTVPLDTTLSAAATR